MKSIKEHLMFILPLMAMLIGVEFILIFNRVTTSYENKLKNDYAILVVSKKELTTPIARSVSDKIDSVESMSRKEIAKEVTSGMQDAAMAAILKDLPYFYRVHLTEYVSLKKLKEIKKQLKTIDGVLNVEIFGENYHSKHTMFKLVKVILNIFIIMLFIVSIFLVIKQMEVWQLAHKKRMKIMEIFGAPLMLRSGILFKIAFIDAIIATILNIAIFIYIKSDWANKTDIDFIRNNQDLLINISDYIIMFTTAVIIVLISVFVVVIKSSEVPEG
jgi:cell division transport system permease protein